MKKINFFVLSFALLGAVLFFSIITTKAVENNATSTDDVLFCTMEYMPVCGVDAKTYGNKCVATNVAIAYEGECKIQKSATTTMSINGKVLEKIPNPELIKNFRVMKNENGTIWY